MLNLHYLKVHGSKNDFILLDESEIPIYLSDPEKQQLSQLLCDRKEGVGADGLMFVNAKADAASMRIFNSDGSEASMCGNGLRCAGRFILEKQGIEKTLVKTMKANLNVSLFPQHSLDVPFIQVEITPVNFDPKSLPMNTSLSQVVNSILPPISNHLKFTALAVPNPHLVAIVDKADMLSGEQERIAKFLNSDNPYFPDGVNVSFVYPISEGQIFVNTYERGVGFTNACGTAMSASSLVAVLNQIYEYEKSLTVFNNGGFVQTVVHNHEGKYWIDLIGNGTYSFEGRVVVHLEKQHMIKNEIIQFFEDEEEQYLQLENQAKVVIKEVFNVERI